MTAILPKPFIINPFLSTVIETFDSLRLKKKKFDVASCMLVTGESGSGKSALAAHYLEKYPRYDEDIRTVVPVLHYQMRSVATPEAFLRSLLIAIGDPQQGKGAKNKNELYDRLLTLLMTVRMELLILDEIQVIMERRSKGVLYGIADLFKDLIRDSKVPIVFMGMPWSEYLVDANEQLTERIAYRFSIPPYRISEKEYRDDYRKLLSLLGKEYQIDMEIKLGGQEMAIRVFGQTFGNMRRTANLIRDAYIESEVQGVNMSLETFARVVKGYGVPDESNSFLLPVHEIELRELVNYSDWKFGTQANKNSVVEADYAVFGVAKNNKIYYKSDVA